MNDEQPAADQIDLSLTGIETDAEAKSTITKTPAVDLGLKEGLGDGVTLSEDFKIDPLNPEDRSVSVGISKRFEL